MAIKLIANYSKRLGLPGYSSHQFSVSVETELVTTDDVAAESERLYQRLQTTVDEQILHTGFVPPADYGMNTPEPSVPTDSTSAPASNIANVTDPPFDTGLVPWAQCLPDHISPTAAKAYLSCSLKFYFERVACIRKATPAALHLGKAVHAALQAFHLARWRGGDDSPEAVANAYDLAFLRLERDEGPVNFDDETEREKCRQDGLRVVAAYLDSPEAMTEKPRAVEVMLKEDIPGLSVPLTGAMDLVEGNFTPVDFKSAAAKPDEANAAFDHEIQLVSYQLLMEAATGESPPSLDLVFLVKTKTPQIIRVKSPPADAHRKRRVTALLETAVEGIASNRHHPQPGMQCSWCQFKNECLAWLPGMTAEEVRRAA